MCACSICQICEKDSNTVWKYLLKEKKYMNVHLIVLNNWITPFKRYGNFIYKVYKGKRDMWKKNPILANKSYKS